jgi:hypothetical protein
MALAYGKVPQSYHDRDVQAVNRCLTRLGVNLRPGLWRVDIYPFLRYLSRNVKARSVSDIISRYIPGYLQELQDGHAEELKLFKDQLEEVRWKMVSVSSSRLSLTET